MKFEVNVCRIDTMEKHPNADRLMIYGIGGYKCISNLDDMGHPRYLVGELVVYIPENALVPEWILKKLGMWNNERNCGFLAGPKGDRVKMVKLRGVPSEGILYPLVNENDSFSKGMGILVIGECDGGTAGQTRVQVGDDVSKILNIDKYIPPIPCWTKMVSVGDDVSGALGIHKYEAPIPVHLSGQVFGSDKRYIVPFDVEPIQKNMNVLRDGEMVSMQCKIHGTNCRWIFTKEFQSKKAFGSDNSILICSKGLGDSGLVFKASDDNKDNVYVKHFINNDIEGKVKGSRYYNEFDQITIVSEIYGVQDLKYGLVNGETDFVVLDVYVGSPRNGRFFNYEEVEEFCRVIGVKMTPYRYIGPFSMEMVEKYTDGKTLLGPDTDQIEEGIVIKPLNERVVDSIGRVMLKSVSSIYKTRNNKDATEFN